MSDPGVNGDFDRRMFLKAAALAAGSETIARHVPASQNTCEPSTGLIDVNVNLSRWPCRRLPYDDTGELVARLRRGGVTQAWAGSFDGLLHKNIAAVNARLAEECRRRGQGLLIPFGSVNPMLPDWEEDLRRCVELHRMPGIRLHPNYHGYKLDEPVFARVLQLAVKRRLIVQLALCMEDERMMNSTFRVPPVNPAPLPDLMKQTPGLRLVLLNAKGVDGLQSLVAISGASEVCLEIAMLEGVAGIERLLGRIPLARLCFGSHAPLFYFESALLKLKESVLSEQQLQAIRTANATRLLPVNHQAT